VCEKLDRWVSGHDPAAGIEARVMGAVFNENDFAYARETDDRFNSAFHAIRRIENGDDHGNRRHTWCLTVRV